MIQADSPLVSTEYASAGDIEAVKHFKQAIADGQHWYHALLEAIGLWVSATEVFENRTCNYLIDGEAFDWLLLAERLCGSVDGLLPEDEKNALLFYGKPPLQLDAVEVNKLIGRGKYGQYLNFFYGVTAEEALVLAVQEEIDKEKRVRGFRDAGDSADEAYLRIYNATRETLLKLFRQEKHYAKLKSISLSELKEFTYWLFKYRIRRCEKARVASDTRKALQYLKRRWQKNGISQVLAANLPLSEGFKT